MELPEEDLSWLMSRTIASRQTLPPPLPLPSPPTAITIGDRPQCRARYAAEVGIYVLPYVVLSERDTKTVTHLFLVLDETRPRGRRFHTVSCQKLSLTYQFGESRVN